MARDEFEAIVWKVLGRYTQCPRVNDVAAILGAADAYRHAPKHPWALRKLKPCGTEAAYHRHLRHGQPACRPCLDAHNQATKRAQAGKGRIAA